VGHKAFDCPVCSIDEFDGKRVASPRIIFYPVERNTYFCERATKLLFYNNFEPGKTELPNLGIHPLTKHTGPV
jgi:hypothetical protein